MQSASRDSTARTLLATSAPRRRSRARYALFLGVASAVVATDQLTKSLIRGWLSEGESWPANFDLIRISRVENPGAAFGLLQGAGGFLVVAGVIAIAATFVFVFWAPAHIRMYTVALALILGGATGNLIDRLAKGTVTDFIDPSHYPAFNIADSSITIAIVILVVLSFIEERNPEPSAEAPR